MKFSLWDFLSADSCASARMRDTVDSPKGLAVRIRSTPLRLTEPEITSSPVSQSRGRLSPVRAEVSSAEAPSTITPSMGIFPPGRTTMISPTVTSPGLTRKISPFRSTSA